MGNVQSNGIHSNIKIKKSFFLESLHDYDFILGKDSPLAVS